LYGLAPTQGRSKRGVTEASSVLGNLVQAWGEEPKNATRGIIRTEKKGSGISDK